MYQEKPTKSVIWLSVHLTDNLEGYLYHGTTQN